MTYMIIPPELESLMKPCKGMPWAASSSAKIVNVHVFAARGVHFGQAPKLGKRVLILGGAGGVGHFAI